ncbi:hypothetical protein LXA43DRAFT_1056720 [Ganoderma leucocontextum]|nr:hypothetical protein LXA43DRAFT_1056720 [Ganoderma leucocontextum]
MAFIAVNDTTLARDRWPNGIGRLHQDVIDMSQLPTCRIVPRDRDELPGWLCVDRPGGSSGAIVLAHPDVVGGGHVLLTLRLQGIVEACMLRPMGNWNGRGEQAARAKQLLTLRGDGCVEPFHAQMASLAAIRDAVLQLLPVGNYDRVMPMPSEAIVLKRRVFTKVIVGRAMDSITLLPQEDPLRKVATVSDLWRITHRVKTGIEVEGGLIQPTMATNIRRGDLVDVAVMIEVVTMRSKRGRQVEVLFRPEEVVRLCSAHDVKIALGTGMSPQPELPQATAMSGFAFNEGDAMEH